MFTGVFEYFRKVFYLNANAVSVTRWDKLQWLKIIWEPIHDPRIQKLCDFGLYKHKGQ